MFYNSVKKSVSSFRVPSISSSNNSISMMAWVDDAVARGAAPCAIKRAKQGNMQSSVHCFISVPPVGSPVRVCVALPIGQTSGRLPWRQNKILPSRSTEVKDSQDENRQFFVRNAVRGKKTTNLPSLGATIGCWRSCLYGRSVTSNTSTDLQARLMAT